MLNRLVVELRCDGQLSCGEIYEFEWYQGTEDQPARKARVAAIRDGWECTLGRAERDAIDLCPRCKRKP